MASVFTDYVRSLDAGGEPPAAEDFDRLWEELRKLLTRELKRRHLWTSPPSYLGIYGWQSWTEGPDAGALEDLASDCYVFVFLDRLRSLRGQAAAKPDVEGLVALHVRNFLHTVQKKQDPLGYKVFDLLRSALRRLLDAGTLHVLGGAENVRNDTIFGFTTGENPAQPLEPFDERDVARLGDAILPAVVTSRRMTPEAVERLAARISELPARGVRVFRFRDLVDPLKADARSRWAKILEDSRGETAAQIEDEQGDKIVRLIAVTRPDTDFEDREAFDKLVECVDRGLRRLKLRARTREYLEKLWAFLQGYAHDVRSATVPAHRQLSELLDIPRERFPELYETLAGLLEQCGVESIMLRAEAGKASTRAAAPAGARSMDVQARREQLRLRTGESLARLAEADAERTGPPRAGDLYVLAGTGELEWAVLLRAAGGCLLVPADTHPLTGSDDVAVDRQSPSGPLNLRCGFAVWVDVKRLAGARRSGSVGADVVARAQARLAEREDETEGAGDRGLPAELEADRDPEYEDWTRDVLAPARDALAAVRPRPRARRSSTMVPIALAAALVAAVVGLGVLRRQVEVLSEPSVDVERHEVVFNELTRGVTLEVDAEATHVLLPLLLHKVPFYEGYVVEIAHAAEGVVWRSGFLEPRREYQLLVPRPRLPAGVYTIRLLGLADGTETLIDVQERRIEYHAR